MRAISRNSREVSRNRVLGTLRCTFAAASVGIARSLNYCATRFEHESKSNETGNGVLDLKLRAYKIIRVSIPRNFSLSREILPINIIPSRVNYFFKERLHVER